MTTPRNWKIFVVHYRQYDSQGGYWPMIPRGPYTWNKAKREAFNLTHPQSFATGRRVPSDRVNRNVKIALRVDFSIRKVS